MPATKWDSLNQRQREALLLIGISSPEQFQRAGGDRISRELSSAFALFPEAKASLSSQEVTELLRADPVYDFGAAKSAERLPDSSEPDSAEGAFRSGSPHLLPVLKRRYSSNGRGRAEDSRFFRRRHGLPRCASPGLTLLGAFSVVLLFVSVVVFLWFSVQLIIFSPVRPDVSDCFPALVSLAGVLPWLVFSFRCKCGVCRMRIFSLKRYPRNKKRHHLPLLGYYLPTALHIILFHNFRCPACGTSQRLWRR